MDVREFGAAQGRRIVLIPGNLMTWRQFEGLIPLLRDEFRLIAVSTDGYDDTGRTTFTTAQASADHLARHLRKRAPLPIDLVFGESMGCATAAVLFHDQKVPVRSMILNGAQNMNIGALNGLLGRVIPPAQYRMARMFQQSGEMGKIPLLARLYIRRDEAKLRSMFRFMAKDISLESIQNATNEALSLYRALRAYETVPDARVGFWHGGKEPNVKSAWRIVKQIYPRAQERSFAGFGHGEVMDHPRILAREIRRFLDEAEN